MTLRLTTLLLLLLVFSGLSAQTDPPATPTDKTYEMFEVEKQPVFPGGEAAMYKFIAKNIEYPTLAKEKNVQGSELVSFVIDKEGNVTGIRIIKDIGSGCGEEIVRLLKTMPKWTPGEVQGQPVNVNFTLPFKFKLDNNTAVQASTQELAPITKEQMWDTLAVKFHETYKSSAPVESSTPFSVKTMEDKNLLATLEYAFRVKLAEADSKRFVNLGMISEYFYKAQFAPVFYTKTDLTGNYLKYLSDWADFNRNINGIGSIASLKVPQGVRVVLFSKKNFNGQKLEINAKEGEIQLFDLSDVRPKKDRIEDGGKGLNWSQNVQSIKVVVPRDFHKE